MYILQQLQKVSQCSFMRLDRGIILTPNVDRSSENMHLSIVDMPVNMHLQT
uniref:Uncharacterized protein n=1 Tax=Anguilla anguilla TaxID=7936 RepID=A0A0E9XW79_ANGAN